MLNNEMNTNRLLTPTRSVSRKKKFGFRRLKQKGKVLNITSRVPSRLARLVQTEAAIHRVPVSTMVANILAARYEGVR